jgi:DNA processing protein
VRLLAVDDEEYPENLRQSSFPPPLLYVRGRLEPRDRYSVAIIGSRRATQYGRAVAQQFAARLAGCGITIASGFARGIDSQAHQSSMDAGGRTVGVLGNGHAVCYPPENQKLGQRIVEQGALVSEYPMETPPDRFNFPERNHVIAAISLGTVVAEAAEKSGALITANQAVEENRFVFAVPGDITRLNSRGTNALIHAGARLVQRPEDILLEMRHLLRGYLRDEDLAETARLPDAQALTVAGSAPAPHQAQGNLSEDEQAVLELIRHEPQYFDALLAKLDPARFTVQKLSTVLLSLELKQAVKQMPGRLYLSLRA